MSTELAKIIQDTLTPEQVTIRAVTEAAVYAFYPRGEGDLTVQQVITTCASLLRFLKVAADSPARTFVEWERAIGDLKIHLGSSK